MSTTNGNGAAAATTAAAQASQKPEPSPALDDEFEDFPHEDWDDAETELGVKKQWEDSWDDDNLEDDFSKQLKAELSKQAAK